MPASTATTVIERKWFTTAEVAEMLNFGLSKTKALVHSGAIRSVLIGRSRRILPVWVDEYVARVVADDMELTA
ncbi:MULTISPECIES: helix-turn-helix domain-containing protein [Streptomyces]|uniref:helix-turn-helix domain-containing protein n=1 Tax=Streptomyces TaxID=1883 RepID=UPI0013C1A853|nr:MULTISPECIES: helix-turn-helix domain-containing protein [unclassified Streptomyces]MCZ4123939.1 helix-turn-helix domain-containing protein [Streptomyces sp. H39-S7]NEA55635.1 helix-turn-helix domain-containing protein [Streptomyces sp. SID13666]